MADNRKQGAFLAAYAQCGSVGIAAKAANVSRRSHSNWLLKDPAYPERFEVARTEAGDRLEAEARRRAVEGIQRLKFYRDKQVFAWLDAKGNYVPEGDAAAKRRVPVIEHRYSDRLLLELLRAAKPKKYIKRHQHKHEDNTPVRMESQEDKARRVMEAIREMRANGELKPRS